MYVVETQPTWKWTAALPFRLAYKYAPKRRGAGFLSRNILVRALPARPAGFAASLPLGVRVLLEYRGSVGLSEFMGGSFERPDLNAILRHVRKDSVVVDVGANVGYFTMSMAKAVGPKGQVWAVEPSPENIVRLRQNMELNSLTNIILIEAALSDNDGSAALNMATDGAWNSLHPVYDPRRDAHRTIQVTTRTMDSLWRENGSPKVSAIKIDVDGHQFEVLRGASDLLSQSRPYVMVEIVPPEQRQAVTAFLAGLGYSEDTSVTLTWANHLFLPNDTPPASTTEITGQ